MVFVSYCTAASSFGFAFAYATHPAIVTQTLFGALALHWVWAFVQVALGISIVLGQIRGGYHMQLAHAFGFIIQTVYCTLWITSAFITGNGWFVWPGVFFLAVIHLVLSRLKWGKRDRGTIAI